MSKSDYADFDLKAIFDAAAAVRKDMEILEPFRRDEMLIPALIAQYIRESTRVVTELENKISQMRDCMVVLVAWVDNEVVDSEFQEEKEQITRRAKEILKESK